MCDTGVKVDPEWRHQCSEKYPLPFPLHKRPFHPRSQPIPSPRPLQPEEPLTVFTFAIFNIFLLYFLEILICVTCPRARANLVKEADIP
ncbi:hypothetical protein M427DRAFT_461852 [Gonapodya prolifera JEL478]|uniref:Uncharacterized protein n=1 Tax=Gonapodya prolifera (strain JEL478) TaxID=1344416 RepID=A0A139A1Y0_GONPJ|nr:hypothetical protein M427DRAFT_461852 [Gonapodya prolifera JEL478]|eukprot:KXS10800.1 hypothetical protein M427DRAFT_461852 [Gonapodya prolifera JEL478]